MATPAEQPSLTVLSGSLAGTVFVVDDSVDNVLIGSDASCRFALPGTGVDPIHARLWIDLEGITVYDTDSPRGVYINDDRVEGQARVRNGDILWLGPPGDDQSVMLQCRLPPPTHGAAAEPPPTVALKAVPEPAPEPVAEPAPEPAPEPDQPPPLPSSFMEMDATAAMNAIDLDPTVSLVPERPPEPEATVALPAVSFAPEPKPEPEPEPEPEAAPEPEPTREFSIDDTPPPPSSVSLLAADAIQPEPTVMMAPEEAFIAPEAEPTVSMLPDDDEVAAVDLGPGPDIEPDIEMPTVAMNEPVRPAAPAAEGWDATAGGIPAAADAPWLASVPEVSFDPGETIAAMPPPAAPTPAPAAPAPPPGPKTAPLAASAAAAAVAGAAAASRPPAPAPPAPAPRPPRAPERPPAPVAKPRREPAVPAPPKRREPPPPPPSDDEAPAPPSRKGAPMGLLIGGALAAAILVGVGAWWMLGRGQATPETTPAPPPTVAQARPVPPPTVAPDQAVTTLAPAPEVPVEEEVTIVPRASPTPAPSKAPSTAPTPAQVARATPPPVTAPAGPAPAVVAAGLVGRAEAARRSGDLDAAADLFDQALHADPQNAAATAGKAAVAGARAAARKAFMPGRTVVQTQSAKADLSGFDTADVSVKKAPDFSGRIEFAVSPPRVKPGDSYSVQVFLVNEGKKAIKVSGASAITNVNGSKSPRSLSPKVKEVAPAQRALLDEMAGTWPEDVTWWSAEVTVAANKGDSLKNTLNWK